MTIVTIIVFKLNSFSSANLFININIKYKLNIIEILVKIISSIYYSPLKKIILHSTSNQAPSSSSEKVIFLYLVFSIISLTIFLLTYFPPHFLVQSLFSIYPLGNALNAIIINIKKVTTRDRRLNKMYLKYIDSFLKINKNKFTITDITLTIPIKITISIISSPQ